MAKTDYGLHSFESKFGISTLGLGIVNAFLGAYWIAEGHVSIDNSNVYLSIEDVVDLNLLGILLFIGAIIFMISVVFIPTTYQNNHHNLFLIIGSSLSALSHSILALIVLYHEINFLIWIQSLGLSVTNILLTVQGFKSWIKKPS